MLWGSHNAKGRGQQEDVEGELHDCERGLRVVRVKYKLKETCLRTNLWKHDTCYMENLKTHIYLCQVGETSEYEKIDR